MMEEVRLYENDYDKPDLTDDVLEHYGVKGMKWGVRKSEERASKAHQLSDSFRSKSNALISKTQASAEYKKNLANFTGNEKHIKSAIKAEKKAKVMAAKLRKANDVLAARAKYKDAVAKQTKESYIRSLDRGRSLVEEGTNTKPAGDILKGFVGRGILTGSIRGLAKVSNKMPGKKKSKIIALAAGGTGKIAAKGYNIGKTISDLRRNADIENYEAFLEERRRQMMFHSDILEGDDTLEHYGILGMKWGVRKDGKPQGFQYGETRRHIKKAAGKTAATAASAYITKKAADRYNQLSKAGTKKQRRLAGAAVVLSTAATAASAGSAARSAYDAYDSYKKEKLHQIDPNKYSSNREAIEARDIKYITANKDRFTVNEMNEVMNRLQTEQRLNDFYRQQNPSSKETVKKILKNPVVRTAGVIAVGTGGYLLMTNAKAYSEGKAKAMKMGTTPPSVIDIFEKTAKSYGPTLKANIAGIAENAFSNMQSGKNWNAKKKK